jgi:flagellar biosynthesis protein FlhB
MAEQAGEKTEHPTPRRLEEAIKQGQFPRSAEVQTVFVLATADCLSTWDRMSGAISFSLKRRCSPSS